MRQPDAPYLHPVCKDVGTDALERYSSRPLQHEDSSFPCISCCCYGEAQYDEQPPLKSCQVMVTNGFLSTANHARR